MTDERNAEISMTEEKGLQSLYTKGEKPKDTFVLSNVAMKGT
jgi:hypothetical protein